MARLKLFGGERVNPILPFNLEGSDAEPSEASAQLGRLSLSGVQAKYAVTQHGRELGLTQSGESGTHILKPIVRDTHLKRPEWMPANEHLTMQLAAQVFDIRTAASGLVFFDDHTPAYLTRRFDRREDGSKWAVEDFAALAGRTPATHGENYKYDGSYLDVFAVLRQYAGAYLVEAGKLFELLIFNYLVGNGDAHFRNFSLIETRWGDFVMAPAYDLLSTAMHVSDTPFALTEGLLPAAQTSGPVQKQFKDLAAVVGLPPKLTDRLFKRLPVYTNAVEALIARSFLPAKAQRQYLQGYQTRLNRLLK